MGFRAHGHHHQPTRINEKEGGGGVEGGGGAGLHKIKDCFLLCVISNRGESRCK